MMHCRESACGGVAATVLGFALACALVLGVGAGCGGGGPGTDDPLPPDDCGDGCLFAADAAIGWFPAGGGSLRLEPPSGGCLVLELPAGAVSELTPVSVRVAEMWPATPDLVGARVYRLGPEGLEFAEPATLTLCYDQNALGDWSEADLRAHRSADGEWLTLGGDVDLEAHTVVAPLDRLELSANLVGVLRPILDREGPLAESDPPAGGALYGLQPLRLWFDEPVVQTSLALGGSMALGLTPVLTVSESRRRVDVTVSVPWPHGDHELTVSAADDVGNVAVSSLTFSIDALPPIYSVEPPPGGPLAPHGDIRITFDEAMTLPAYEFQGSLASEFDGGLVADGVFAYDTLLIGPATTWSPGNGRDLVVIAADASGNRFSFELVYDIDTLPPSGDLQPPSGSRLFTGATLSVTFSEEMNPGSLELSGDLASAVGTTTWETSTAPNDTLRLLPAGAWPELPDASLRVVVTDRGGNPVRLDAAFIVDETPPTVLLISPDTVPVAPTDPLVIQFSESMRPSTLLLRGHLGRDAKPPTWRTTDTSFTLDTLVLDPSGGTWPLGVDRLLWVDVTDSVGLPIEVRLALRVGDTCGNSAPNFGEDCDDAGETALCDADCTSIVCGDGELNLTAGEVCDDANASGGDGCALDCLSVEPGYRCDEPGAGCEAVCTENCLALFDDAFVQLDPARWTVINGLAVPEDGGVRLGVGTMLATVESFEPVARDGLGFVVRGVLAGPRTGVYSRAARLELQGRPQVAVGAELWPDLDRVEIKIYPPLGFVTGDTGLSAATIDALTLAMLNHPLTMQEDLQQIVSVNTAQNLLAHRAGPDGTYGSGGDDDPFDDILEIDLVLGVGQSTLDALHAAAELWTAPFALEMNIGDTVDVRWEDSGFDVTLTVKNLRTGVEETAARAIGLAFVEHALLLHNLGSGSFLAQRATLETAMLYGCRGPVCEASGLCALDQPLFLGKSCHDFIGGFDGTCDGAGVCIP